MLRIDQQLDAVGPGSRNPDEHEIQDQRHRHLFARLQARSGGDTELTVELGHRLPILTLNDHAESVLDLRLCLVKPEHESEIGANGRRECLPPNARDPTAENVQKALSDRRGVTEEGVDYHGVTPELVGMNQMAVQVVVGHRGAGADTRV